MTLPLLTASIGPECKKWNHSSIKWYQIIHIFKESGNSEIERYWKPTETKAPRSFRVYRLWTVNFMVRASEQGRVSGNSSSLHIPGSIRFTEAWCLSFWPVTYSLTNNIFVWYVAAPSTTVQRGQWKHRCYSVLSRHQSNSIQLLFVMMEALFLSPRSLTLIFFNLEIKVCQVRQQAKYQTTQHTYCRPLWGRDFIEQL